MCKSLVFSPQHWQNYRKWRLGLELRWQCLSRMCARRLLISQTFRGGGGDQGSRTFSVTKCLQLQANGFSQCICSYFMCVNILLICVYVFPSMVAEGGQKRTLDPQELELQVAVSYHSGAGTRTPVLCKSRKCLTAKPSLQPQVISKIEKAWGVTFQNV